MAVTVTRSDPRIRGRGTEKAEGGIPARPEEVSRRGLPEDGRTFPDEEEEYEDDEADAEKASTRMVDSMANSPQRGWEG